MSLFLKTAALACAALLICSEAQAANHTPISRSDANSNLFLCSQTPDTFTRETPSLVGCCFEDPASDITYCTMCTKETKDCAEYEARDVSPRGMRKQIAHDPGAVIAPPVSPSPRKRRQQPRPLAFLSNLDGTGRSALMGRV